ncbi:MAG: flavodoxin family protein [Candidatus Aenigmarchaeota archaeon]|nr:flavodoxin family protein [Candidatus Aenigmarchaeota archaeon]
MKILSVCGSPRKGNSEAVLLRLKQLLEKKGAENEIILLREKKIERCTGCVEYCNKNLDCHKKDDMVKIFEKIRSADGYVFITPNYFKMPTGIFKDFIDRCSIFYTAQTNMSGKRAIVITVGADVEREIDVCLRNVTDNFCKTLGIPVVAKKSFRSKSELKGNYNDIFENGLNPDIEKQLEKMADELFKSLKK